MGIKELDEGWSFTEIGGGEGTGDGEWLNVERVPTTVHVELLKAGRIPDPVRLFSSRFSSSCVDGYRDLPKFVGLHEWDVQCQSSFNRVPTFAYLVCDHDFDRGRREGMGIQDHVHRIRRRFECTKC